MLSSAAFNAFLKTLEEPPHHALFILATTEKHKVLPTILSRCQIYDFSRISIADMVEHLEYVSSCEGVTAEPEALNVIAQKADVLLMGGDYQEGCEYVDPLFSALARVKTPMGTYGVMGNNDYERCHDEIIRTMKHYGMHPLEHEVDTLRKDGQQIIIAGVRNPFDLGQNGKSPTLALSPRDFVIMLVHTPDYVEDVSVVNTDLALAGHTHGGQVCVFGIAPVLNSNYGTRFLTGLACNSAKIPLIVTNGIGTSQLPIRIGAPAEVIMITLHRLKE